MENLQYLSLWKNQDKEEPVNELHNAILFTNNVPDTIIIVFIIATILLFLHVCYFCALVVM
jgi:hypothetical protein